MSTWTDRLAATLGVGAIPAQLEGALLKASREIAHRTERKDTPLSTYLVGVAVGLRQAAGEEPDAALEGAIRAAMGALPPAQDP